MPEFDFSNIEPYHDDQVPEAIRRLSQNAMFRRWIKTVNPKVDINSLAAIMECVKTCDELQFVLMRPLVFQILKRSSTSMTYSGLDQLDPKEHYLYVANHRDIILDAAILDAILVNNKFPTPEIGFGNNLLKNDFMTDIFRLNKMFTIIRDGSRREFYNNSLYLSAYIHYALFEKHSSVWIAQRNGRTKDGNDRTDHGLLKMFSMAAKGDFEEDFNALHIVPVAMSYELEPCDASKATETYISSNGIYTKSANEDMISIMSGINLPKGDIHCTFCKPITPEEVAQCASRVKNDRFAALASIIDDRIYLGYQLSKTNYIAADLLSGSAEYEDHYTTNDMEQFIAHVAAFPTTLLSDQATENYRDILLSIYANPLKNKLEAQARQQQ
ncbi:MAG: 1-acyl-sn-glycerol-3-phosphate acyltransferase [Bacteroidales bacterium]|nr:1-acyl-sn-glycerol-3-phosphate acyltransferase [Bacteroidales bacterium]